MRDFRQIRSPPASLSQLKSATACRLGRLTLLGLVISVAIRRWPLGVLAATRPGSWIDHLCRVTTTAGVSLPVFFTGLCWSMFSISASEWSPAPLRDGGCVYSAPPRNRLLLIDALIARDFETSAPHSAVDPCRR